MVVYDPFDAHRRLYDVDDERLVQLVLLSIRELTTFLNLAAPSSLSWTGELCFFVMIFIRLTMNLAGSTFPHLRFEAALPRTRLSSMEKDAT